MNMNGSDAESIRLLDHFQIKPSRVLAGCKTRQHTTTKFEQTTIGTFFIYIYFFTFSLAIGIQFQMIFSFSCCCLSNNNLSSRYHHTDIFLLVSRVR
jgi:hypothetical protein